MSVLLQMGQFTDDRYCSRLRTLIAHFTPVQVRKVKVYYITGLFIKLSDGNTGTVESFWFVGVNVRE